MQSSAKVTIFFLIGTLFLGGCSFQNIVPTSHLMTPADLGSSKTLAHLSIAQWPKTHWWKIFADPQLDELVSEALRGSPTLAQAAARVRGAQAIEGTQDARLRPHLDANLGVSRLRYSENGTASAVLAGTWQTLGQGSLDGGYEVDLWGKNRAALEAVIGRARATDVDEQGARLVLAFNVVQAYIELARLTNQLHIEQQILSDAVGIHDLAEKRLAAKLDNQIDLVQAQTTALTARTRLLAIQESLELTRNRLSALVGQGPDRGEAIRPPNLSSSLSLAVPSQLPVELLGHRPDVVAQRWRVEAASEDIKVAKAQFYPNMNLSAVIGLQSLGLGSFANSGSKLFSVGPALSLPLFDGGRLRANLASQDAAYDLAVEQYNQTLVDALHDIADQLASIRWLTPRLNEQQRTVDTAEEAFRLVEQRYAAGLATYIQVLSAQAVVSTQRRDLTDLQARGLGLQASLARALGGGYRPESFEGGSALN